MYFIVIAQGCFPYLYILRDFRDRIGESEVLLFDTKQEAEKYAKLNCAWEYRVYRWVE